MSNRTALLLAFFVPFSGGVVVMGLLVLFGLV